MNIPDEAVEAAASQLRSQIPTLSAIQARHKARMILRTALPHLAIDRSATLRQAAAIGWDKAVESMVYEDGSKVEVALSTNPYRSQS